MTNSKMGPPPLLADGAERTRGRDAMRMNIMAARTVAETVRTTLGPMGMDKMLVDSLGDVLVTNDGATIMREMDVQHPVARMMIEVARAQEASVGDGTTTVVVLAGELLKEADGLIDLGIHPVVIGKGYRMALEVCLKALEEMGYIHSRRSADAEGRCKYNNDRKGGGKGEEPFDGHHCGRSGKRSVRSKRASRGRRQLHKN